MHQPDNLITRTVLSHVIASCPGCFYNHKMFKGNEYTNIYIRCKYPNNGYRQADSTLIAILYRNRAQMVYDDKRGPMISYKDPDFLTKLVEAINAEVLAQASTGTQ